MVKSLTNRIWVKSSCGPL